MKPGVFLDTGFWIALLDRRDNNHGLAKAGIGLVLSSYRPFVSDFVIFETLTYLNCSLGRHDLAMRFLGKTELAGLNVVEVDKPAKAEAIALFRRYSDKDFSVTDCTSFVLMGSNRIRHFAGFDAHFTQMGFLAALAAS
jgi:predicted nucleic acid-binding protein